MKSLFEPDDREELLTRLAKLTPHSPARWGKMTATQMLAHLSDPLRGAMGEIKVAPQSGPFGLFPLKQLIIYVLPFPKSAPAAPEFIHQEKGDWDKYLADFHATLNRFVARGPDARFEPHPAFKKLSGEAWAILSWRHIDHHLKQFGA